MSRKEMPEAEASLRNSIDRRVNTSWLVFLHQIALIVLASFRMSVLECSFPHWKVEEQPNKKPKHDGNKSAVATVNSARQLSCVSQDTEPPDSTTIPRKGKKSVGTNSTRTIHKGCIASSNHPRKQRSVPRENTSQKSSSPKSLRKKIWGQDLQERLQGQERCARGVAWEPAKQGYILCTFWGVGCTGRIHNKPEERESLW